MSKDFLFIGPRFSQKSGVGGVVVLFEMLLLEMRKYNISYCTVDSNIRNYKNFPLGFFLIIYKSVVRSVAANNVSLHVQNKDFYALVPVVIVISKLFKKKVSVRKFAGDFIEYYEGRGALGRRLIEFCIKRADACFFETKYLVKYFGEMNSNTYWFPNVRSRPDFEVESSEFRKKLVFVGQVKESKGIVDLVEAFDCLDSEYTLDIYGPVEMDGFHDLIKKMEGVFYKGELSPAEVAYAISRHDIFVMPTFHPGEGYPGVIIEAFSVGVPVVSTNLKGIIEIVEDGVSGVLVRPRDVSQLIDGLKKINNINYSFFSRSALKAFDSFDSDAVTKKYFDRICHI